MNKTAAANISEPISASGLRIGWLIALLAALGLFSANLIFGNLNQDEGWYLYAARLISSGKMPYRDFAFTQGPVMPFAYSLAYPLIQWGGLATGRMLTAALGITGALCAAVLAGRIAQPGRKNMAILFCFALTAVNVYQSYFCTVVKTYALAILLLASAFWILHYALVHRKIIATMLAAALLVLASGTRFSAAVVLPIIFILLWLGRRRLNFAGWLYFAIGGTITAVLVFGPFLLQCPDNFIYFAGRYHTLRHEGNLFAAVVFKAGFVSRVLQAYFVCFTVWLAALTIKYLRKNEPGGGQYAPPAPSVLLRRTLWLCGIAVTLVHFGAPFPYDDYQVFVYPLFAAAVAAMLSDVVPPRGGQWVLSAVLGICLVSAVSSPINQDWFIEGRELIWWRAKDKPALVKLRETARELRSFCKPCELLLTQDPYLAVESGCALPHGLEMGQFSYFPDLTDEQAKKLNVLNRALFAELLTNCPAPVAALSGYAFAMNAPQITPLSSADKNFFRQIISNRYELFETIPNFGQAATELRLYRKK